MGKRLKDKVRLSKKVVDDATPPKEGQYFLWDRDLTGFGLRVTPTKKSYVVQTWVKGSSVRHKIGPDGPLTPAQARQLAHEALANMAKGINVNEAARDQAIRSTTLGEAYQEYTGSRTLSANTLRDYEKAMRLAFDGWRTRAVRQIDRNMVERRYKECAAISPLQANQMFRFLRALLNFSKEKYATSDGEPLMHSNPCDRLTALKLWARPVRRERYIAPTQLAPWFAALNHGAQDSEHQTTVKDFCAFVLLTGCREQEAARLRWVDVDPRAGTVCFIKTKNGKAHTLPVGPWLSALLRRRQDTAPLSILSNSAEYVFPAQNAQGHLKYHAKAVKAICAASGVEFRLHDLRRTFASIINHQLGRSLTNYTIKKLMNHMQTDVTGGYIQFGIEDLREPMRLIEEYVLKCAGIVPTATVHEFPARDVA